MDGQSRKFGGILKPNEGRSRVIIENVKPQIDCGRHAAKRVIGDTVHVTAAIYSDGHDHVAARLLFKREGEKVWRQSPFRELGNDVWTAEFTVDTIGPWLYTVQAWVDHFDTWVHDLHKRIDAQDVPGVHKPVVAPEPGGPEQNEGVNVADENTVALQDAQQNATRPLGRRPESDIALAFRTGAVLLDQASARAKDAHARELKSTLR